MFEQPRHFLLIFFKFRVYLQTFFCDLSDAIGILYFDVFISR